MAEHIEVGEVVPAERITISMEEKLYIAAAFVYISRGIFDHDKIESLHKLILGKDIFDERQAADVLKRYIENNRIKIEV